MITDYTILLGTKNELIQQVREYLADGWILHGPPFCDSGADGILLGLEP